jgi:hypothetical protein
VCLPPREERKTSKSQTSAEGELQELHAQINEYCPSARARDFVLALSVATDNATSSQACW